MYLYSSNNPERSSNPEAEAEWVRTGSEGQKVEKTKERKEMGCGCDKRREKIKEGWERAKRRLEPFRKGREEELRISPEAAKSYNTPDSVRSTSEDVVTSI